MQKPKTFDQ